MIVRFSHFELVLNDSSYIFIREHNQYFQIMCVRARLCICLCVESSLRNGDKFVLFVCTEL